MDTQFPKWVYHKSKGAKLIQDEAEFKTLGKGWTEEPAGKQSVVVKDNLGVETVVFQNAEEKKD